MHLHLLTRKNSGEVDEAKPYFLSLTENAEGFIQSPFSYYCGTDSILEMHTRSAYLNTLLQEIAIKLQKCTIN